MEMDELARKLSFKIAENKEQEIREGLISLGWLPPEEVTDQSDRIRELEGALESVDKDLGHYGVAVTSRSWKKVKQALGKPEKDAILP